MSTIWLVTGTLHISEYPDRRWTEAATRLVRADTREEALEKFSTALTGGNSFDSSTLAEAREAHAMIE